MISSLGSNKKTGEMIDVSVSYLIDAGMAYLFLTYDSSILMNSGTIPAPLRVVTCCPSTNTGALGSSPVPGSEMPMFACFDSPGPLTMQPMTATLSSSEPG